LPLLPTACRIVRARVISDPPRCCYVPVGEGDCMIKVYCLRKNRRTKRKPVLVFEISKIERTNKPLGGSVRCDYLAFDMSTTPPTLIDGKGDCVELCQERLDFPKFYFDQLGDLRGGRGEVVMAGPNSI
jgi:hypothetical protein